VIQQKNYLLQQRTFSLLQKGKAGQPYFLDEACFHVYLNRLLNGLKAFRVQLHTYVLLPCEVQLLASPHSCSGLTLLVEKIAIDYGEYFSNRFGKPCPLPRCKPTVEEVQKGGWSLDRQRTIELAPVRARLVDMPGEYPWSGYRINAFGGHKIPMAMHKEYRAYCFESRHPYQRYRDFVAATSSADNFHPRS
jgi:putative transposase